MSKKKEHKQSKLEDLLHSNNSIDKDAFEKDAFEGFSELSFDEAVELKNELDSEFYESVMTKKNYSKKSWYWLAAAALLIGVVGFVINFYYPGQSDKQQLVVQKTETTRQKSLPIDEKIILDLENKSEDKENTSNSTQSIKSVISQLSKSDKNISETQNQIDFSSSEAPLAMQSVAPASNDINAGKSEDANVKSLESNVLMQEALASAPAEQEGIDAIEVVSVAKKSKSLRKNASAEAKPLTEQIEYTGGSEQLYKDLKPLLIKIACNKLFEATLFFDSNLKIEKVIWNDDKFLKKADKKLIQQQLEQLSNFFIKSKSSKESKYSYTLIYKP